MIKPGTRGFVARPDRNFAPCVIEEIARGGAEVQVRFCDLDGYMAFCWVSAEDFTPAKHDIPGEEDAA